jgi:hemoglobin/transferrin/lactoferrin receptor protein
MKARDTQNRTRVSFAHEMDALDQPSPTACIGRCTRRTAKPQVTDETRTNGSRRHRVFSFDQHAYGLQAQFNKAFSTGSVEHALTYGFEGTRTEIRQKRDGYQVLANGQQHGAAGHLPGARLPDQQDHRAGPVRTG